MSETAPPESSFVTWQKLCQSFATVFPPDHYGRVGIVLAVSGGADSVALARLVTHLWSGSANAALELVTLAHYNHKLRGPASDADQRFVEQLGRQLNVSVAIGCSLDSFGMAADEAGLRDKRYEFLRNTVATRGARCLLTAHNADDQIETVLHHLFRGTGPVGLCGIPARRSLEHDFQLLRPLLGFRSEALRAGLREIGQDWCEDHTNTETQYSRNWIRGELLPLIRKRYPAVDHAILRLIDTQGGWHQLIARLADDWMETNAHVVAGQLSLRQGPVDPAVLAVAITVLWDRMGWPRRNLSANHHLAMHNLVAGKTDSPITLPGSINGALRSGSHGQPLVVFCRISRSRG